MDGERAVSFKDVYLPEVLFEFHHTGVSNAAIRVVAIDPITKTEVTMVGAPGYGDETLKRLAARKLAYVIARRQREKRRK